MGLWPRSINLHGKLMLSWRVCQCPALFHPHYQLVTQIPLQLIQEYVLVTLAMYLILKFTEHQGYCRTPSNDAGWESLTQYYDVQKHDCEALCSDAILSRIRI
eukprot:UN02866